MLRNQDLEEKVVLIPVQVEGLKDLPEIGRHLSIPEQTDH